MNRAIEGVAALVCIIIGLVGFFSIAGMTFLIAPALTMPSPQKSDKQLCEERGGVYVQLRSGPNRCFAKEAFK